MHATCRGEKGLRGPQGTRGQSGDEGLKGEKGRFVSAVSPLINCTKDLLNNLLNTYVPLVAGRSGRHGDAGAAGLPRTPGIARPQGLQGLHGGYRIHGACETSMLSLMCSLFKPGSCRATGETMGTKARRATLATWATWARPATSEKSSSTVYVVRRILLVICNILVF